MGPFGIDTFEKFLLKVVKETDLPSELVTIFTVSKEETDRKSLDKKVQFGLETILEAGI